MFEKAHILKKTHIFLPQCSLTVERLPHMQEVLGSIHGLPNVTKHLNNGTNCFLARCSASLEQVWGLVYCETTSRDLLFLCRVQCMVQRWTQLSTILELEKSETRPWALNRAK